jgi:hypothetical protein
MTTPRLTTASVRNSVAGAVRAQVRAAAGSDGALQVGERQELGGLALAAAVDLDDNDLPVNDVVDRAMSLATAVWARHNQQSGTGQRWLSQVELRRIRSDDAVVGAATDDAAARVRGRSALPISESQARTRARDGLVAYVKATRMHDGDWSDYFPTTWAGNVARGIEANIAAFVDAAGDTEVSDEGDHFLFVGRGPYDLYTEVEVAKQGGKVKKVYIEID